MNLRLAKKTNCTNTTIHKYTCSHLLPEHCFPGINTNGVVFSRLGIPDTKVPSLGVIIRHWVFQLVPKYHLVPYYTIETTLYPRVDAVPEF